MTPLRLIVLVTLSLWSGAGLLHATLPPEAQAALDRGVTAARLPDYPLAIRYFEEARKLAPEAPEVCFNLGLAESKIPGRELRAIAWFGAYLSAQPSAPNAGAVRSQIDALFIRHQSDTIRLLRLAEDSADRIAGSFHSEYLYKVATAWAEFGDFAAAQKTIRKIVPSARDDDPIYLPGAAGPSPQEQMRRHVKTYHRLAVQSLSDAQAASGDTQAAHHTLEQLESSEPRASALCTIAAQEYALGNAAAARKTLAAALKAAERIDREPPAGFLLPEYARSYTLGTIARVQVETGDPEGATRTIGQIKHEEVKCSTWFDIAAVQFKAGNTAAAIASLGEKNRIAARLPPSEQRTVTLLAEEEGKLRQKWLGTSLPPPAEGGPPAPTDWLARLDDENKEHPCALRQEFFLDLDGFLKGLPADDGLRLAGGVIGAAESQVGASKSLRKMLRSLPKIATKP